MTTVGYGDITGTNTVERIFCALAMVVGVIAFSFVNGALASIISDSDHAAAKIAEQQEVLNKIRSKYSLPFDIFTQVRNHILYETDKDLNDRSKFMTNLPDKLKAKVSVYVFEEIYETIRML